MENQHSPAKANVEIIGYHKHNGITSVVEFKKTDFITKHLSELDDFRTQLRKEIGEDYQVYLMFRHL